MIEFKIVELSDKGVIDSCLSDNKVRTCDYCFGNLHAWQTRFKTSFAVIDNTLFLRYFDYSENAFCYIAPVGKMGLQYSLQLIIQDAQERGDTLIVKQVTSDIWTEIDGMFPNTFKYRYDRDNYEYIYLSEKLIKLNGDKLQSKRNHINRFKRENNDWSYARIVSRDDLSECLRMLDKWENLNIAKAEQSLRYDYIATKIMIDNFHYLGLVGGAIKVKGDIVAFTIGERLTDDTFVIHVEKAYSELNGAYTIINQQFVLHEAVNFPYINREEDMGVAYLRKAKMSYDPYNLLEKRVLMLREE